jgi:hypothetical protein
MFAHGRAPAAGDCHAQLATNDVEKYFPRLLAKPVPEVSTKNGPLPAPQGRLLVVDGDRRNRRGHESTVIVTQEFGVD